MMWHNGSFSITFLHMQNLSSCIHIMSDMNALGEWNADSPEITRKYCDIETLLCNLLFYMSKKWEWETFNWTSPHLLNNIAILSIFICSVNKSGFHIHISLYRTKDLTKLHWTLAFNYKVKIRKMAYRKVLFNMENMLQFRLY